MRTLGHGQVKWPAQGHPITAAWEPGLSPAKARQLATKPKGAPGTWAFLPSLFCPSIHPCGWRVFSCDFQCKSLDEKFLTQPRSRLNGPDEQQVGRSLIYSSGLSTGLRSGDGSAICNMERPRRAEAGLSREKSQVWCLRDRLQKGAWPRRMQPQSRVSWWGWLQKMTGESSPKALPSKSDSPSQRSSKWPSETSGAVGHVGLATKTCRLSQARRWSPRQPLPQHSLTHCPNLSATGLQLLA